MFTNKEVNPFDAANREVELDYLAKKVLRKPRAPRTPRTSKTVSREVEDISDLLKNVSIGGAKPPAAVVIKPVKTVSALARERFNDLKATAAKSGVTVDDSLLKNGSIVETIIFEQLQRVVPDLKRPASKYSRYDFISEREKMIYEVKSRTAASTTYASTMIALDKFESADTIREKSGYNCLFIFVFTDCEKVFEYSHPDCISTFESKEFRRTDRGDRDVKKQYVYIPTDHLRARSHVF